MVNKVKIFYWDENGNMAEVVEENRDSIDLNGVYEKIIFPEPIGRISQSKAVKIAKEYLNELH